MKTVRLLRSAIFKPIWRGRGDSNRIAKGVEIRRWLKVMIFFIKRKCFDVRGVRGFGLVLELLSLPPISLTHSEFSLVMLKESMNPQ